MPISKDVLEAAEREPKKPTILQEAEMLVSGQRQKDYGSPIESFSNIAQMWSSILKTEVSYADVALCMIALKLSRYKKSTTRDSLVDIAGYARALELCAEEISETTVDEDGAMARERSLKEMFAAKLEGR